MRREDNFNINVRLPNCCWGIVALLLILCMLRYLGWW